MNQTVYLESSAWVKRYVAEPGSTVIHALLTYAQAQSLQLISSAWLGLAEVVAVLHRLAHRGELGRAALARLVQQLAADRRLVRLLSLGEADWAGVVELVVRHSLTAADAVHLQAALSWWMELGVDQVVFVSADRRLLRAARREGLVGFDVERGDWAQLQELLGSG
jgi:predicted nucleic acid-binding protein